MKKSELEKIVQHYELLSLIFDHERKMYMMAKHIVSDALSTCILMDYSEEVNESTRKILQKIEDQTQKKMKGKSVFHQKIICPSKIICDTFNKKKVLLMFIQCQPLPLEHFISYSFTYPQILRILKEGLEALEKLHEIHLIHGQISTWTCYMSNHPKTNNPLATLEGEEREQIQTRINFNIIDISLINKKTQQEENYENISDTLFQSQNECLGIEPSYKDDLQKLVYVLTQLISKGKLLSESRYLKEWKKRKNARHWKLSFFYKEMVRILPAQLQIISDLYLYACELEVGSKPDYTKLLKEVDRDLRKQKNLAQQAQQRQEQQRRQRVSTFKSTLGEIDENIQNDECYRRKSMISASSVIS